MVIKWPSTPRDGVTWGKEAIEKCRYDFSQVLTEVTIVFVAAPGPAGNDHFFAYTTNNGLKSTIEILDDLDDPNRPGNEGGAYPGTYAGKAFFQESIIHEIAHVIMGTLFNDSWEQSICTLFGATTQQWSAAGLPWQDRILEATAETFKDIFTDEPYRKFTNRTNWLLPEENLAAFAAYFTVWNPLASGGLGGLGHLTVPVPQVWQHDWVVGLDPGGWGTRGQRVKTERFPSFVDRAGVFHDTFDSIVEVANVGPVVPPSRGYSEHYPAYLDSMSVFHEGGWFPVGEDRPQWPQPGGGPDAPLIEGFTDPGDPTIVELDLGLPGHINRHRRTNEPPTNGVAGDGLPEFFQAQYPQHILDGSGHPSNDIVQSLGFSPNVWGGEFDAELTSYPATSVFHVTYNWAWPDDVGGVATTWANGPPIATGPHQYTWKDDVNVGSGLGEPSNPVQSRVTVVGDWIVNLFQPSPPTLPRYPKPPVAIYPSREMKVGPGDRGNVRYERSKLSLSMASNADKRAQRRVVGRQSSEIAMTMTEEQAAAEVARILGL